MSSNQLITHALVGFAILFGGVLAMQLVGIGLRPVLGLQGALVASEVLVILGAAVGYRNVSESAAPWPDMDPRQLSFGSLIMVGITTIAVAAVANLAMEVLIYLWPPLEASATQYIEQLKEILIEAEGLDRVLGIAAVCLFAPVCEEALFRGTILPEQLRRQHAFLAVVGNGLLFSAFHMNPIAFVSLAVVGMFFSHTFVASRHLLVPVIGHAALNILNGLIVPSVIDIDQSGSLISEVGALTFFLVFLGLLALTILLWQKTVNLLYNVRKSNTSEPTGQSIGQ
jgi:membrane protease YdiL (CAAX protease family)